MASSSSFQAAFKSKIRLVDNGREQQTNPKAADRKIAMDLSIESAIAMSAWLNDKIEEAEQKKSTVRVYVNQNQYTETPGFTMWGSLWGNSGSFSPGVVRKEEAL